MSDTTVSLGLEFRVYYRHHIQGGSTWVDCDKFLNFEQAKSYVRKMFANDNFSQEQTGTHANAKDYEEILIEPLSASTQFPAWVCSLWDPIYNSIYEKYMIVAVPVLGD